MNNLEELINGDKPVLLDFFGTWCAPCRMMEPVLKELKNKIGENGTIVKVDVDKNQHILQYFQIRGIPTFIVYKKGKQVWRDSGIQSLDKLEKAMQ